jgi:hypothetical protein
LFVAPRSATKRPKAHHGRFAAARVLLADYWLGFADRRSGHLPERLAGRSSRRLVRA